MNANTIDRQLSLVPLAVLNAAAVCTGSLATQDKEKAVVWLRNQIIAGRISLEQVKQTSPNAATAAEVPADIRNEIERVTLNSTSALHDAAKAVDSVRALEANVVRLFGESKGKVDALCQDIAEQNASNLRSLDKRVAARLNAISPPEVDIKGIRASITAEVTSAFSAFRKTASVAAVEEIANALPPRTNEARAADIFGAAACQYRGVDFRDLPVQVWGDRLAPAVIDDYVFQPEHLHQALLALDDVLPDNCWLAGERGTGKTEFVVQIAARLQRRCVRVNFDEAVERADFIGGNTIENGTVKWSAGAIAKAIQHPGAIILLDEIGFARAGSIAVLHSLCERSPHRALTINETGQSIPVAPGVVFFCCDNSNGHGNTSGNFADIREQNSAFIDRFSFTLRFDYLRPSDEAQLICSRTGLSAAAAEIIVGFATVARQKASAGLLNQPPSLRQLFALARAVKKGLPLSLAFRNAVVNKFHSDCEGELLGAFSATFDEAAFTAALST
jgi:MoxR-like ATPase